MQRQLLPSVRLPQARVRQQQHQLHRPPQVGYQQQGQARHQESEQQARHCVCRKCRRTYAQLLSLGWQLRRLRAQQHPRSFRDSQVVVPRQLGWGFVLGLEVVR